MPYEKILEKYDRPTTLFYLDPPYWNRQLYRFNFSESDFVALEKRLHDVKGKFILSRDGKKDGDANRAVIEALTEAGALLAKGTLRHQYPHSWRSKAPVIFRATPQWFAAMDKPFKGSDGESLRSLAMKAIEDTEWYPPAGENRMRSMVETRPDWVLSRQRAWGVPLAIFVNKETDAILNDHDVNARIVEAFKTEGADAWFKAGSAERFLGSKYKADIAHSRPVR